MNTENSPSDSSQKEVKETVMMGTAPQEPPPIPTKPIGLNHNIEDVVRAIPWKKILGWVIASNPLFLLSALFMLQGIYMVSVDPQMFGEENSQLAFNFSSLQVYELMLVLTALFLARRNLWHDTALLFWLENLFVFVPFILISQASMMENRTLWSTSLCVAATIFTALRFTSWKLYLHPLNLPKSALALGGVLLLANLIFPLHYRNVIANDSLAWAKLSPVLWIYVLPLLAGFTVAVSTSKHITERSLNRKWTPLAAIAIWLTATAVHLRSLDYLDGIRFQYWMIAPLLWSAAWVSQFRLTDITTSAQTYRHASLALPMITTLLAINYAHPQLFLGLTLLNCVLYAGLLWRNPADHGAKEFLLASLTASIAALPIRWGHMMIPDFSREKIIILAIGAYLFLCACRSKGPKGAIIGAILCGLGSEYLLSHFDYAEQLALQNALLFGLGHSFFWPEERSTFANALWKALALALPLHSLRWGSIAGLDAALMIALASLFIVAIFILAKQLQGHWANKALLISAAANGITIGINYSIEVLRITPTGYLVVLGAFLFFVGGIAYALMRERWFKSQVPHAHATPAIG